MATSLKSNRCAIRFWVEHSEEFRQVKLYVQPGDGVMPLVEAINNANEAAKLRRVKRLFMDTSLQARD